jgi:hypothetical protein
MKSKLSNAATPKIISKKEYDIQRSTKDNSSKTIRIQVRRNKTLSDVGDKPYWIWNMEQHRLEDIRTKGDCCLNYIVSLPKKNTT